MSDNGLDSATETIDPRVQIELERLNSATDDINKLEVDLDCARDTFRALLCESAARLDGLSRKLGSCIEKARPYYEARMRASEAAREAQEAAVQYERANSAHSAAREMVYLAEQGLGGKCTLDPAWQEMLNHATQRVNEAEAARAQAAGQHLRVGKRLAETTATAQKLQRELRKSIAKSSLSARRNLLMINVLASQHDLLHLPYFEMKAQFNQQLELQKIKVQALEKQVCNAKLTYADALRNLEQISDEIHRNRKKSKQLCEEITDKNKFLGLPDKNTPNIRVHPNRYSDPIVSFSDYPYGDTDTAIFYNQTYIPDSNNGYSKLDSTNNSDIFLDEYKSLPSNISSKSTPTKTKNYPEEISGYRSLPLTNASLAAETNKNPIENDDEQSVNGLTKSITNEWTEINLDSSSPEELMSDSKNDIPYERFDVSPQETDKVQNTAATITTNTTATATPKKRLLTKQLTLPASTSDSRSSSSSSLKSKMKLDTNITNWISRSSAKNDEDTIQNSSRRQSLDNILGPTSEKVKEIFSQGIMMLNISSLTERRNSEPKSQQGPAATAAAQAGVAADNTTKSNNNKKVPSPLEKTLTYLTSNNDDDTTGSDTDSLASCDMLTEEQIQSLMLDRDIDLACEQMFGTPVSEVCPKFVGVNQTVTNTTQTVTSEASVDVANAISIQN